MSTSKIKAGNASVGLVNEGGDDGTLRVVAGPAGSPVDAIVVAADGKVSFPLNTKHSRHNVVASRAIGTPVTNNTGDWMFVEFAGTSSIAGGGCVVTVDAGPAWQSGGPYANGQNVDAQFMVPDGSTYTISSSAGVVTKGVWIETNK